MSAGAFVGGAIGGVLDSVMGGLTSGELAANSYLPLETLPGDAPSEALANILMAHMQSRGSAATPFSSEIAEFLNPVLGGLPMSFVNAGDQSSSDALNDMPQANPFMATRWPDGSERSLREGVPIFALKSNLQTTAPGYAVVASPVKINDMQLKLAEMERAVAFYGLLPEVDDPRRMRFRAQNSAHAHDFGTAVRLHTAPVGNAINTNDLAEHRYWASTSVQGLFRKMSYVGPVLSIHARENGSHSALARFSFAQGESYLTHAFGTRARIHNMFSVKPEPGEQFYFSLGEYDRDDLLAIGLAPQMPAFDYLSNIGQHYGGKRGFGDISSAYVTTPERNAGGSGNAVVQLRGWASRSGQQWLSKTSPIDSMKPELADRFYAARERRAAVEWVDTEFDAKTGELLVKKTLDEGMQEAVANLPSIVLENYIESVAIYPVGHVKGYLNPDSTPAALHNAHYDMSALVSQPLVEIYLTH